MKRATALICSFLLLSGTIASAERDLIPTLDNQPDVCPDQPPVREALSLVKGGLSQRVDPRKFIQKTPLLVPVAAVLLEGPVL